MIALPKMHSSNTSSPQFSHPKYRPDIDGLRAIAVLAVLGFHAYGVTGGFSGVDIFFVISGFLISTIIFENLQNETFQFNEFYQRRIRRIFPSLLLVLITCLVLGWVTLFADEYQELGKHTLGGAGFVSNLVLWGESGYFDVAAEKKPLLHLWSLGIEEQFYILWPFIAYLLWRFRQHFLKTIAILIAISFCINVLLIQFNSVATFYLPLTRFWELLVGAAVADVMLNKRQYLPPIEKHANGLSMLGLLLLIVSIAFLKKDMAFPGWWALMPVFGAALLIMAGPNSWVARKILSNRILVWFGLISFPLYLWHWPLLTFVRILSGHTRWMMNAAIALSILLAWLSYRYLERPIRQGSNTTNKSIGLVALMVVVALCSSSIYLAQGFESRIDDGTQGKLAQQYRSQLMWPESYNHSAECIAKYGSEQYCMIADINRPPTAALIGDSHANHFYPGLSEYFKNHGGNLLLLGAGACAPFIGIDRVTVPPAPNYNCYQKNTSVFQHVLHDQNIKTVVISFRHNLTFASDFIFKDQLGELKTSDKYEASVGAMVRTIKALEAAGKQVVLIYDTPDLSQDIKLCSFKRPYLYQKSECQLDQIAFREDFEPYNNFIDAVRRETNVTVFDTRPYLKGNFPVDSEGNLNYRDSTHLSHHGSLFFADKYNFLK